MPRMTTPTVETPELDVPHGYFGTSRVTHVRNLLARATIASVSNGLSPEIVSKMRRHHQVASCLLVQSLPLVRADWSIECDDDAVRETLTAAYSGIAFDVHRSMTRALWAGFSPNTLTWSYRDDVKGIYPTEIRDLDPRTCRPLVDDAGTFDGFEQTGDQMDPIDPLYSLWITEGYESGNYYGRSLLTAALDPWADFAAIRAFHARYLERFGEPVVLCRAPAGKSIANRAEIEAAVAGGATPPEPIIVDNLATALTTGQELRHHSVVALPSTLLFGADGKPTGFAWNLEFLEAKAGGGTDFLAATDATDRRIARAMFVPDLLSQNDGNTGSNALGQTHKDVWSDSVEGRLDDYSRQITRQLLDPSRVLNFGPASARARLVFAPLSDEEKDRDWELVVELVKSGRLPVDGRALAEEHGLPLLDAADPAAQPAPPPAAPAPAVGNSHTPARVELSVDPVAGLPDWRLPQDYNPPAAYARALNDREKRVGFARIESGLNAAEQATVDALTAILDDEHDRVLRQLAAIIRKGSAAEILAGLGTIELKAGPKVTRAWAELMSTIGDLAIEQLRVELAAYADSLPAASSPAGRALFRAYAETSADRALTALVTETRLGLLNAYTSGVTGKTALSALVGQVFDTYQGSEGKPIRLTTRMLSAKSLNYSRAAAVEAGGIPLAGAQYSAILDRRTCDLCVDLDEKIIPIESTDLARFTPPVHHNCRCVWVWITRDEPDFTPTWSTPAASKVDRFGGLVIG
jgi:hypothetical protein